MSVNRVILIGNLGNDPEIRQFDNGMLATASIATSERWTDKQTGERKEQELIDKITLARAYFDEVLAKLNQKTVLP